MNSCESGVWKNIRNELEGKYPWSVRNKLSSCIAWFRTDNALYGGMKSHTETIKHDRWKGKRSEYLTKEEVHNILSCFLSRREECFSLLSFSDYKDTYLGKNLLPGGHDVYVKFYRVKDAPLRIRIRNILRRCLARKSFVAFYELKKKNIKAVLPLFYVIEQGSWISDRVIFASFGAESNRTVERLLALPLAYEKKEQMMLDLGSYIARLQFRGILYGEIFRNLIGIDKGSYWSFMLCDLDEMRSVSEKRPSRHNKVIESLAHEIEKRGPSPLHHFYQGYRKELRRNFHAIDVKKRSQTVHVSSTYIGLEGLDRPVSQLEGNHFVARYEDRKAVNE